MSSLSQLAAGTSAYLLRSASATTAPFVNVNGWLTIIPSESLRCIFIDDQLSIAHQVLHRVDDHVATPGQADNGFGSGGVSGVRPLPKSMPRPAPTSVLFPLFAGVRSVPLSLTRSFCLSTPFAACANAGSEQAINISRPIIMRNIATPFTFTPR